MGHSGPFAPDAPDQKAFTPTGALLHDTAVLLETRVNRTGVAGAQDRPSVRGRRAAVAT